MPTLLPTSLLFAYRPIYAGNALETVQCSAQALQMLTVRTTAFDKAATDSSGSATVESVSSDDLSAVQVHLLPCSVICQPYTCCTSTHLRYGAGCCIALSSVTGLTDKLCLSMQSCTIDTQWENDSIQKSERPELDAARVVISGFILQASCCPCTYIPYSLPFIIIVLLVWRSVRTAVSADDMSALLSNASLKLKLGHITLCALVWMHQCRLSAAAGCTIQIKVAMCRWACAEDQGELPAAGETSRPGGGCCRGLQSCRGCRAVPK